MSPTPTRKIIRPTELTASPKYKTIELSEPFLKFNCKTQCNKKWNFKYWLYFLLPLIICLYLFLSYLQLFKNFCFFSCILYAKTLGPDVSHIRGHHPCHPHWQSVMRRLTVWVSCCDTMVLLPNLAPQYGPQHASPATGNIKESDLKQTHLVVSSLLWLSS